MSEAVLSGAALALGGQIGAKSRAAYQALKTSYAVGERAYHGLHHVQDVLDTFFHLWDGGDEALGARVALALLYHDAVYDPRAKDNEAQSATMAREALASLGIGSWDLDEVERLILVTRDHRADDLAGSLVVDADLAILQSAPHEYDRYAAAIRQEYAFVPEDEYRAGRTRVLERLLSRRLFTSPLLDEAAARANLRREIGQL